MFAVTRHRVEPGGVDVFVDAARDALAVLATCPGWVDGALGRCVDDPTLWALTTRWRDVGSYRRALSAYDVRVRAVPLLSTAIDEPSGYEVVVGAGADGTSSHAPGADTGGPGAGGRG